MPELKEGRDEEQVQEHEQEQELEQEQEQEQEQDQEHTLGFDDQHQQLEALDQEQHHHEETEENEKQEQVQDQEDEDDEEDEDEEDGVVSNEAYVLLQRVNVDITEISEKDRITCSTDLYLTFQRPVDLTESISLNFRQGIVTGIRVNDAPTSYYFLEPMQNLGEDKGRPSYKADLSDINYRAGLEVGLAGECKVSIPESVREGYFSSQQYSFQLQVDESYLESAAEIIQKLINLSNTAADSSEGGDFLRDGPWVLKISVDYFLQSPQLGLNIRRSSSGEVQGVNTLYGGGLCGCLLQNYDGVRCWLPCIDQISQRTYFDVRIRAHKDATVIVSGTPVLDSVDDSSTFVTRKFVTKRPVCVSSLGVFSGICESFVLESTPKCMIFVASSAVESTVEEQVRWTTLGSSIGMNEIRKIVNIEDFGDDSYTQVYLPGLGSNVYALSGFGMLDLRYLHSKEHVYMELSSHLNQMKLYLYSNIINCILLDNYRGEFIIHGLVGYLMNRYIDTVFGSHDSNYRFQKMHDTVLHLESSGYAYSLFSLEDYELYERFSPQFIVYMRNKAPVVFHMMENILGGHEYMRAFVKSILSNVKEVKMTGNVADARDQVFYELFVALSGKSSTGTSDYSTLYAALTQRTLSIMDILRNLRSQAAGLSSNSISENTFADRWIFGTGLLYLRAAVEVDTLNRTSVLVLDQVGYRHGSLSENYMYDDRLSINVVEADKTQTEFFKGMGKSVMTHTLPFQAKLSKKIPGGKKKKNDDVPDENMKKQAEKLKEDEHRREHATALAMARKGMPPIRYISIDPYCYWIKMVHVVAPETMFVEQLYMDIEILGQINALRQMTISRPGSMKERPMTMCVKAMSDCLLHVKSNQIEITHHKFVRSEAAFALARWQCEYAPKTSVGDEDTLTSTWRGLHALKTAIHTLFSYEVEETDSGGKGSSQNKKVFFLFLFLSFLFLSCLLLSFCGY